MNRILDGLNIIARYEPEFDASAEHDIFYAGDVLPEKFTSEELAKLEELGWSWDTDCDSWYHFT